MENTNTYQFETRTYYQCLIQTVSQIQSIIVYFYFRYLKILTGPIIVACQWKTEIRKYRHELQ